MSSVVIVLASTVCKYHWLHHICFVMKVWYLPLIPVWLTSDRADLVGDGVSQDTLLFDVHNKHPLHGDLQRLQGGGAAVMTTVAVGDVLLELEGEGLRTSICRHNWVLPHRGGGGNWRNEKSLRQTDETDAKQFWLLWLLWLPDG